MSKIRYISWNYAKEKGGGNPDFGAQRVDTKSSIQERRQKEKNHDEKKNNRDVGKTRKEGKRRGEFVHVREIQKGKGRQALVYKSREMS